MLPSYFLAWLVAVKAVAAQSCENSGTANGSICSCPPGFGGPTCNLLACGGTIFLGSNRPLAQISGSSKSNLSSCSCQAGWGGTGCNGEPIIPIIPKIKETKIKPCVVCTTAGACQSAFNTINTSQSIAPTSGIGLNSSMTCNIQSRVYAAGEMSCQVLVRFQALNSHVTYLFVS